jgi:exopolysaccharide production protein ExoQ
LKLLRWAEKVFVIIAILLLLDAIFPPLMQEGLPLARVQKLLMYIIQVITIGLLLIRWRQVLPMIFKEKLLWLISAIALFSVLWSISPSSTFRANNDYWRVTLFALYFANNFDWKEQLRLMAISLGICAWLSLVFGLLLPQYGVMGLGEVVSLESLAHSGAWRGIFYHKNTLGRAMSFGVMVLILYLSDRSNRHWLAWSSLAMSSLMILLSTSKTSLVITLTIFILLPLYRALRWKYSLALPLVIISVLLGGILALLFVDNAETIAEALGRDLTLTGRTDLWAGMWEKIQQRPWFGYGLGGFWKTNAVTDLQQYVGWAVQSGHNGFLDLILDLGWVGFSLFLTSLIYLCIRAVLHLRQTRTVDGLIPISYLTFLFFANLTESSLLSPRIFWSLYVINLFNFQKYPSARANFMPSPSSSSDQAPESKPHLNAASISRIESKF